MYVFFSFCSHCVCVSSNVYQSLCIIKNVFKYFTKSFGAFTWSKFSFLFPIFCFIWYAFACWMYKNNNINIYLHANWKRRMVNTLARSSHPEVFLRKSVLKICNKFTGEHPCRSVISIPRHGCSSVNLQHIFRTPFLKNTSGWLLLTSGLRTLLNI